ncbi:MAG: hypothetical protein JOZ49_23850 [Mycolicibacterium sp.]|nr:hypothetical protein [Mycolicibacterium sp.]
MTVDAPGNVYVVDAGNNRVLKLAVGSTTPTALPFAGIGQPNAIAVDTTGNGSTSPTQAATVCLSCRRAPPRRVSYAAGSTGPGAWR